MGVALRAPLGAFVLVTTASAACNGLIGNHDRVFDDLGESGASTRKDATADDSPGAGDDGSGIVPGPVRDADVADEGAAAPIVIDVSRAFTTPNGAQFTTTDAGTQITGGSVLHAVINPSPQPAIPSDDYTVEATVHAGQSGEFGILARVQSDGWCALLGSKLGTETKPFVGSMGPVDWNPGGVNAGAPYTFTTGARYKMKLRVVGQQASGKMWDATTAEPALWQVVGAIPWSTGRGTGYYVYGTYDTTVESLRVTVP